MSIIRKSLLRATNNTTDPLSLFRSEADTDRSPHVPSKIDAGITEVCSER